MARLQDILDNCPDDEIITKSITTTYQKIQDYEDIFCSVSGGSDSDLIIEIR